MVGAEVRAAPVVHRTEAAAPALPRVVHPQRDLVQLIERQRVPGLYIRTPVEVKVMDNGKLTKIGKVTITLKGGHLRKFQILHKTPLF